MGETEIDQLINRMVIGTIAAQIIWFLIQVAFWVVVVILVSKYLAKQISKYFDYDRLAQRTAEEICKRMLIIEKQKAETKEEETAYSKAFKPGDLSSDA